VIQLDEKKSASRAATTLKQEPLLKQLEKSLKKDKKTVVAKFDALRAECNLSDDVANTSPQSGASEDKRNRRCPLPFKTNLIMGILPPTSIRTPPPSNRLTNPAPTRPPHPPGPRHLLPRRPQPLRQRTYFPFLFNPLGPRTPSSNPRKHLPPRDHHRRPLPPAQGLCRPKARANLVNRHRRSSLDPDPWCGTRVWDIPFRAAPSRGTYARNLP
jgi:hypothetical protein